MANSDRDDGGVDHAVRRDEAQRLSSTEGYPIYLHNVGGKEPDGKPTRLGKWTFGTKMVKDVVLDHVDGRVLNACAGKTRLQKRGCEFFRNDIDEDRDADLHVDVREIHQHLESETFDAAILDPPFDPGRAEKLYEGWHGQEYSNARDAVGELVAPGGTVVELGWNSWSLSDKHGWEPVEHHIYRQSSFKADVHLTVDRKVNQKRLVTDGGVDQQGDEDPQWVLSLCDRSGNMLRPWARAGYRCVAVDLENDNETEEVGDGTIYYKKADVREYEPLPGDYRIGFAFPPCTDLAVSGARWFSEKGLPALAEAIEQVAACQKILQQLDAPWMLENPKSTLSTHWREPDYSFDPFEYDGYTDQDEAYTKDTWLWTGNGFRMPAPDGVDREAADDRIHKMPPGDDRAEKRSETPTGFAQAVFLAHERDGYALRESRSTQADLNEVVAGAE